MQRAKRVLSRIVQNLLAERPPERPHIDYIDVPMLEALSARIPVGESVAISHNFERIDGAEQVEEVPLGEVVVGGRHGQIRQRGIRLLEFSWHGGHSFLAPSHHMPTPNDARQPQGTPLRGKATSTVGFASRTYGHVLLDELPLLLYLLDSGRHKAFDTILASPMALRLLQRFSHPDIPALTEKVVKSDPDLSYPSTDFTALKRTGCAKNPSLQELTLVRRMAGLDQKQPRSDKFKAIYLKRDSSYRAITNSPEVETVMRDLGISIVVGGDMADPWRTFAQADLVVGVAGSDLSDSCFMAPDACLFEIHPTDHVQPYNWNVACKLGLRYEGMLAKSSNQRGTPLLAGNSPVHIDTELLKTRLSALIAPAH